MKKQHLFLFYRQTSSIGIAVDSFLIHMMLRLMKHTLITAQNKQTHQYIHHVIMIFSAWHFPFKMLKQETSRLQCNIKQNFHKVLKYTGFHRRIYVILQLKGQGNDADLVYIMLMPGN